MKAKSVGTNVLLNISRQGLSILFPLITYPYALRVLGAEGIGKVNYGQSIVSYFALIATLGTADYIVREGSRRKNNKAELQRVASEVYTINILLTIIAYVFLFFVLFLVPKFSEYKILILLQSSSIMFTTFGIDWINTIYEDFVRITVRSIITYFISFILLFIFVKNSKDYYLYALLTVITTAIICISNRVYFRKKINIHLVAKFNFRTHIRALITLFANSLAITINTNFDIIMLGWMQGDYYVGIYSLSVKIYSVIRSMICAIFNVAIPRLSFYIGNDMENAYKELNTRIWACVTLVVTPVTVGLLCEAKDIAAIMGGYEMESAKFSLQCLAIALFFSTLSGEIMNAMNISLCREKENVIVTTLSTGINAGLNFIFIPLYAHNGAAITTLISEIFVMFFLIVRFSNLSRYLDINIIQKELRNFLAGGLIIAIFCITMGILIDKIIIRICINVIGSIFIYILFLKTIKDNYIEIIISNMKWKKQSS